MRFIKTLNSLNTTFLLKTGWRWKPSPISRTFKAHAYLTMYSYQKLKHDVDWWIMDNLTYEMTCLVRVYELSLPSRCVANEIVAHNWIDKCVTACFGALLNCPIGPHHLTEVVSGHDTCLQKDPRKGSRFSGKLLLATSFVSIVPWRSYDLKNLDKNSLLSKS